MHLTHTSLSRRPAGILHPNSTLSWSEELSPLPMRRLAYRRGGHWRNGVAKSPATTRNRSVQRPFCIGVPTDIDVAHSSDIRIRSCRNTPQQTPASRRGGRRGPSDSARQHTDLQVPPERHDPYLRRGEGIPVLSCHPGPPRRQNSPLGIRTVIAHAAEIVLVHQGAAEIGIAQGCLRGHDHKLW